MDHAQARRCVIIGFKDLYGREPTVEEAQPVQGVGGLETAYGKGWRGAGKGSFNMGAIQRGHPPCDPSRSFLYTDTHPNSDGTSTPYSICFAKYASPEDGFKDLIREVYKRRPSVLEAAQSGSLLAVSTALYKTHYYEGYGRTPDERIQHHCHALTAQVYAQAAALGESVMGHANAPIPHRTLRRGMYGADVKALQQILHVVADGMFGAHTEAAVKQWQVDHGLKDDGVVGPITWGKIDDSMKLPEDPFVIP